ncbi:MAG: Heparinase family protein [Devosia sp.]|uniref:heparinase II/III family protein n=1 Tax=Devosia sp. TaxID=1871048 RepID=UPI00260E5107|nr:alginate lyase family protein [Devosia sp.]MDB5526960.1 Heparinase family protein [Devosia sp.]
MLSLTRWRFLNETREILRWDDPAAERLWLYNLHYFEDLNAEDAADRRAWHEAIIARWIVENPPGSAPGWEPYPTSLRIVNWIKFALAGNALSPEARHSLAIQVRWLTGRLEWHLLGNHLFANAKALVFAGLFFDGEEAEAWRLRGQRILDRELPEQILADGGQFERSTMYHALALEDGLDLLNLARAFCRPAWAALDPAIARMRHWLAVMSHPDGEITFFNDAAIGIAPSPAELEHYAGRLDLPPLVDPERPIAELPASGYVRVAVGPVVALLDMAPLGPDYLPGHGHADTLSLELSFNGRRVVVNSGTGVYGGSPERLRQRGTRAHNTVVLNGLNSSQVWGGFRVARRARPIDIVVQRNDDATLVAAAHDGYRHLAGNPVHRRQWRFTADEVRIEDTISGAFRTATAHLHFHPDIDISPRADGYQLALADGTLLTLTTAGGNGRIAQTTWHPQFGLVVANKSLVIEFSGATLTTILSW